MRFIDLSNGLPPKGETVLVRGWGDGKKHYVWEFAEYVVETACTRWVSKSIHCEDETLWFDPVEWALLPDPPATAANASATADSRADVRRGVN